ncbi:hypothetical protein DFP72DRAFT_871312 [Ephemerocybe angulata]|uniref:Uncharacterized protein n=1 Tax=Ephemerocybe angulata TaxID=980116 RepID=A0A8H6IH74_9AGAR|nr:hypothetical protein DFP72DRAFT_871312 [Tulosesus angulatus]
MADFSPEEEKYDRASQIYYPIAIWLEVRFYACLFIATCRIMLKRRRIENFASGVFLVCNTSIFILATIHNATSLYRLVRAYALVIVPPHPYMYFNEFNRWDNFSHLVILALCTWIGDGLVIYRCFLIWRRNLWVIVLPVVFLLVSMATTFVNWRWFKHPQDFKMNEIIPIFNLTFPLNMAQNVLTTGLIAYKIYMQHRASRASGLQLSSAVNLVTIVRIIVESAMVYTIVTAIIIILFFVHHPAVVVPQYALPPSIGESFHDRLEVLSFALIAIRTHVARTGFEIRDHEASAHRQLNIPFKVTTVTVRDDIDVMTPTSKLENEFQSGPSTDSERNCL